MPKKNNKNKQTKDQKVNETETSGAASFEDTNPDDFDFSKMPDKIPEEFYKIIKDFTEDIKTTFPEYSPIISKWWTPAIFQDITDIDKLEALVLEDREKKTKAVFAHCLRVIPERFFDILYQNEEMFAADSAINTEFLPGIVFKYLWTCDISEKTRETIWKYLQLMLFSIVNSIKSSKDFGESAKLFEAINEDELKKKLEETLNHMQNMFDFAGSKEDAEGDNASEGESASEGGMPSFDGINMENMPSAETMHEHIQNMMQGNLGKLAMELAEETAGDLNLDMDNEASANDVFQKLFKNPGKLMGIVKNLGAKLDAKIKSGEIKESELISEGMDMLNKMKSMPGMGNMHEMLSKMGIPGMQKGGKVNVNAMEAQMQKNLKMAQMKERMKKKAEQPKASQQQQAQQQQQTKSAPLSDEQLFTVFSKGEKCEKSLRSAKPVPTSSPTSTTTGPAPVSEPVIEPTASKKK
jgi:hypothetical protein